MYLRVRGQPIFILHTLPSKEHNFSEFREGIFSFIFVEMLHIVRFERIFQRYIFVAWY
jgi:hypothetical protein